jgi:hypothetical protein
MEKPPILAPTSAAAPPLASAHIRTTLVAQPACRHASRMSSFVDDTSSLTSLTSEPAEKADRPRQQSQASNPSTSLAPSPTTWPGKRKREKTSWIWTHGEEVSVNGAAYWQCSLCSNRAQPKRYKVSAGTRAPATHLKDKHVVEEEIVRKAQRLVVQKSNIEQAVANVERIRKLKAEGSPPTHTGQTGKELRGIY